MLSFECKIFCTSILKEGLCLAVIYNLIHVLYRGLFLTEQQLKLLASWWMFEFFMFHSLTHAFYELKVFLCL